MAGFFSGAADLLKNAASFFTTAPQTKISPISNVSSTAPQGFLDTANRTVYEQKDSWTMTNPFKTSVVSNSPINITAPLNVTTGQAVTISEPSSGSKGNIWDVLKKAGGDIINTGVNVLTQKLTSAIENKSPEISYNPNQSLTKVTNPFAGIQPNKIMEFLNPTIQPAVSEGIKSGIISVASSSSVWIWLALGGIALIFIMRRK